MEHRFARAFDWYILASEATLRSDYAVPALLARDGVRRYGPLLLLLLLLPIQERRMLEYYDYT